jgi:hypothetical protein
MSVSFPSRDVLGYQTDFDIYFQIIYICTYILLLLTIHEPFFLPLKLIIIVSLFPTSQKLRPAHFKTIPQPQPVEMSRRKFESPLLALGRSFVLDATQGSTDYCSEAIDVVLRAFLNDWIDSSTASTSCLQLIGTTEPMERLQRILSVGDTPLPPSESGLSLSTRKKTACWSENEDLRLLAGIHRFGLHAWNSVASFIGNSRRAAQCAQRWTRCLDPRISRARWQPEDDTKLQNLVAQYGGKAWAKVAIDMGNRSDAQCRYRYRQLQFLAGMSNQPSEQPREGGLMMPTIQPFFAMSSPWTMQGCLSPLMPTPGFRWIGMALPM